MNPENYRPFNRRGRELGLAARPLLVLSRGETTGHNHNNQNQNKNPLTRFTLQILGRPCAALSRNLCKWFSVLRPYF